MQLQPLVDALRDIVLGQLIIHADETPVQMLAPGSKKTHRSYVWAYATSQFCETAAVVYDFSPGRAGEHSRNVLQGWKGKLVCDDFGGYKTSFELGVTEIGCMAHARRKFFELHATNKSMLAEQALRYIQLLYEIESEVPDLEPDLRRRIRQEKMPGLISCACLEPVTKDTPWHSQHVVKLSYGGTAAAAHLEIYHLRCPRDV